MNVSSSVVSPGLWALAWRRLRADRIALIAMAERTLSQNRLYQCDALPLFSSSSPEKNSSSP